MTTTTTTKALHTESIAALRADSFADGTYNITTMEPVEFTKGYQVTFWCIGDNYTDDDYEFISAMFTEVSMDGETYAGKFEGSAEISWRFADKETAIRYAKMFNQISIWDWSAMDTIETGGTGRR